jgi:hypothetical protein
MFVIRIAVSASRISVADPHHLDADPDPTFHFDADPDPAFHLNADPDPSFQIKARNLKVLRLIFHTFWHVIVIGC